jgi:SAM-dependent methyltransferase
MQMASTEQMNKSFLDEYNSQDAILKYSTETAGQGVNYLIQHEYARIYNQAIDTCLETSKAPLRVLEFGCGAGMNLIGLLAQLRKRGIPVAEAVGTDFSVTLIDSAKREARAFLPAADQGKVRFHVARNERLRDELAAASGKDAAALNGAFDFIFGVNTFRYCHRFGTQQDCANDIFRLLRPGGVCVMIDMNDRFPLFRSQLKGTAASAEEAYLPSLEEYASPFERAGFTLMTKGNFCWVPHSAGRAMTTICRALTPLLNATVRSRAMRTLVVARKPA